MTDVKDINLVLDKFDQWAESLSLDDSDIIDICLITASQKCVKPKSREVSGRNLFHDGDVIKRYWGCDHTIFSRRRRG